MKLSTIYPKDLPALDPAVRECINRGDWLLFRGSECPATATDTLYLKTDETVFALGIDGSLLQSCERQSQDFKVAELVYFSEPSPSSR